MAAWLDGRLGCRVAEWLCGPVGGWVAVLELAGKLAGKLALGWLRTDWLAWRVAGWLAGGSLWVAGWTARAGAGWAGRVAGWIGAGLGGLCRMEGAGRMAGRVGGRPGGCLGVSDWLSNWD